MDECNNTHFNVKHSMMNTDYLSPMYELHYWQDIQWSAFNSKYFQRFAHWNQIAEVKKSVWSIMFSISHFLWDPSIIRSWMYSFSKYVLLCMEADIDTVEVLDYKMINKTNNPSSLCLPSRESIRASRKGRRRILMIHAGSKRVFHMKGAARAMPVTLITKCRTPVAFLMPTQSFWKKRWQKFGTTFQIQTLYMLYPILLLLNILPFQGRG